MRVLQRDLRLADPAEALDDDRAAWPPRDATPIFVQFPERLVPAGEVGVASRDVQDLRAVATRIAQRPDL